MIERHARRSQLALVLLLLLAMSAASCSSNKNVTGVARKAIPHEDADDIVQTLATTLSSDNGGWYGAVQAICDTLAVPAPALLTSGMGAPRTSTLSTRTGTLSNFNVSRAGVTYLFLADWLRVDGSITAQRDTNSRTLQAVMIVDGGAFLGGNGVSGTYGLQTYSISSPIDHTFVVGNLARTSPDTLEFSGFLNDSTFSVVQSTVTPSAPARLWFHENFVDYTLEIPKRNLLTAPYPVSGDSEIHWTVDVSAMTGNSLLRTDTAYDYLIQARMTFDGSPEGMLTLSELAGQPSWSYLYKVNLITGRITRLN